MPACCSYRLKHVFLRIALPDIDCHIKKLLKFYWPSQILTRRRSQLSLDTKAQHLVSLILTATVLFHGIDEIIDNRNIFMVVADIPMLSGSGYTGHRDRGTYT